MNIDGIGASPIIIENRDIATDYYVYVIQKFISLLSSGISDQEKADIDETILDLHDITRHLFYPKYLCVSSLDKYLNRKPKINQEHHIQFKDRIKNKDFIQIRYKFVEKTPNGGSAVLCKINILAFDDDDVMLIMGEFRFTILKIDDGYAISIRYIDIDLLDEDEREDIGPEIVSNRPLSSINKIPYLHIFLNALKEIFTYINSRNTAAFIAGEDLPMTYTDSLVEVFLSNDTLDITYEFVCFDNWVNKVMLFIDKNYNRDTIEEDYTTRNIV